MFQKHLRHLRGFAGTRRCLQHESIRLLERVDDAVLDLVYGQGHGV
jgi:hypothetical protein